MSCIPLTSAKTIMGAARVKITNRARGEVPDRIANTNCRTAAAMTAATIVANSNPPMLYCGRFGRREFESLDGHCPGRWASGNGRNGESGAFIIGLRCFLGTGSSQCSSSEPRLSHGHTRDFPWLSSVGEQAVGGFQRFPLPLPSLDTRAQARLSTVVGESLLWRFDPTASQNEVAVIAYHRLPRGNAIAIRVELHVKASIL